jgi:gamma-glutamylcyclotransferase (GGCT)/AIG2-like uncharacterized protein YtfP
MVQMGERLPVFVYGTLRPGQPNYRVLAGSTIAEHPATLADHQLYIVGLPYVTPADGATVIGTLMVLAPGSYPRVLETLDRLEGYRADGEEFSHYLRRPCQVTYTDGAGHQQIVTAWVYLAGPHAAARLTPDQRSATGDWLAA